MNLVFVRGLIREKAHWADEYTEGLKKCFPNAHFIFLDILGAGEYYREKTPLSMQKIVDRMRIDFQKELQQSPHPKAECHLISISLGGMISFDWMNRFPNDFSSCLIANTSLRGLNRLFDRLNPKNFPHLLKIGSAGDPYKKERLILEMVSNRSENYERHTQDWGDIQSKRPVGLANTIRQLFAAATFSPPRQAPSVPTLLVKGEGDRMVSPKCSDDLAQKWNLNLISHPTAGHAIFLDEPQWIVDTTRDWIDKNSQSKEPNPSVQSSL